jgi:cell division protein ZapA
MAEVSLPIGGHSYTVACRDGGEEHLRTLAARVDAKVGEARAAVGLPSEIRQLLFAALLLADEANEALQSQGSAPAAPVVPQVPTPDPALAGTLTAIAARMESLAYALEQRTQTS